MKKVFKFLLVLFVIFAVLCVGAFFTLRMMFPMEKIKAQLQTQVKNKLNREIDFKDVSISFGGLKIKQFALSEKTTFKEGTFISAQKAIAKVDLKALLHKQIKIEDIDLENLTVNINKNKDGEFNFADLISQEQTTQTQNPSETQSSPIDITAKQIYIKDASFNYNDEQSQMNFVLDKLNMQIDNFDLTTDFSVLITFLSEIKMPSLVLEPVIFNLESKINLASLDMPKAKAEITDFSVKYDTTALNFSGLVADFSNPQINLTGSLSGIDSNLVKHFTKEEITPFSVPVINMILSAKMNLEKSTADISQAKASIGNSYIKTRASVDYSKEDTSFTSNTNIALSLDEITSIAKQTLEAFDLKGVLEGDIYAAQNKTFDIKGKLELKDIGAQLFKQKLENTNGILKINSLNDMLTNKWSGLLSAQPWNLTLSYKKTKNTKIDLDFYMKKFILEDIDFESLLAKDSKEDSTNKTEAKQNTHNNTGEDLYDLKAKITIDQIENNVLTANNFVMNTDIKDFNPSLLKTQGTLDFNTKEVEIRDIDKLLNTSKLLKAMFTSVKVVQKAFNFAKLDNSSITNGIIKCSMLSAEYALKDGVVDIIKSDIDSDLTVVKATGKVDLLKDAIDMKIQAQLANKPLVIKVKGPLSDPSYKVDVLSSLSSIVKNSGESSDTDETKKDVASSAGEVIKSIGSLFKKSK